MVSDAAATKAPIAKIADKVSGVFVPVVISIAVITIFVWLLCGETVGFALARGISVLVISCPCALGLATPVAIMVGNGVGAKNGIMFKTAVSLEETGKIDIVALDKTGTITAGEPKVTDIIPADNYSEESLMALAAACNGAVLTGTRRLAMKESDRGAAMAEELAKLGVQCVVEEDTITIPAGQLQPPAVPLNGHNDHRVVMALSLLLSRLGGSIEGAQAVRKSFPDFFAAIRSLGIEVELHEDL